MDNILQDPIRNESACCKRVVRLLLLLEVMTCYV